MAATRISLACKANKHDDCAMAKMSCACFCHPQTEAEARADLAPASPSKERTLQPVPDPTPEPAPPVRRTARGHTPTVILKADEPPPKRIGPRSVAEQLRDLLPEMTPGTWYRIIEITEFGENNGKRARSCAGNLRNPASQRILDRHVEIVARTLDDGMGAIFARLPEEASSTPASPA